jgi:hypothetical protein
MQHCEKINFSDETFLTAGVLSSRLVPRPLLQTTSIFILGISPLILRSAVPIATFMCLVLKHLV